MSATAGGLRTCRRISYPRGRGQGGRWRELRVGRGEILGLVGESGSGKSITGFSILGLIDPPGRIVAGWILFEGKGSRRRSARRDARPAR